MKQDSVQDLVAISPTSMVASYQMRMMAEQAVFALNGATLASSGNQIALSLYFPQNDPQVGWHMCSDLTFACTVCDQPCSSKAGSVHRARPCQI